LFLKNIKMHLLKSLHLIALFVFICFTTHLSAQQEGRYKSDVFSKIDSITNVQYGEAVNLNNEKEKLLLDIYMPKSDTEKKRPLLIGIHGGGFVNGNKSSGFQLSACKNLAKKGYVTTSINYRLGVEKPRTNTAYFEAMYRAVQDAKAAVRFFRKNAEMYGIDTSKIYILGSSAGSMTALQLAYLDQNEVPSDIKTKKLGTLEGTSGNAGFSSKVHGVVNCWGAMIDYKWINKGDVPLYCVHGTSDTTVPYDASYAYHGFAFGSKILHERALALGIPTGLRLFEKAGHNIGKENSAVALVDISTWLFDRVQNNTIKDAKQSSVIVPTSNDVPAMITLKGAVLAQNLKNLQTDAAKKDALNGLLAAADKIVKKGQLYSVMNKKKMSPSGDKHDYMSQAPYYWPDTTKPDGLPYIRRDGERNPEYYDISDPSELHNVEDEAEILSLAYFYTKDEKYAEHAAKIIKTWFLNAETKMNPHLNFGQGIPGINTGRGIGIIETRGLFKVADAAQILRGSKNWSDSDHNALKKWFSDYLKWMIESPIGKDEAKAENNHGTFYDVQVVLFAIFTGQNDIAKKQLDVTKKRIAHQLKPDGSQPEELARTTAWSYVNMNLWGFFQLARLGEHVGVDLWQYETGDKQNLRKCVDWLLPYLKKEKKWDYQQIKKQDYENTVTVLRMAAVVYNNPAYDALAKVVDTKVYNDYKGILSY
jgi:dienelactone hydrolase